MSISVDLDGTLAKYHEFISETHIGDPIPLMLFRVQRWIAQGKDVVIFSARARTPEAIKAIEDWTEKHCGKRLRATNIKETTFEVMYDDRAIRIKTNTGKILSSEIPKNEE